MIPVDGGGFDLSTPEGDPAALRAAAAKLAAVARESGALRSRAGAASARARGRWSGVAASSFGYLAGQVGFRISAAEPALEQAAAALTRWAGALEQAQGELRDLQRRWRAVVDQADVERRRLAAGLPPGPQEPWEILAQGQSRLGIEAARARSALDAAARSAAATLARCATDGVPGGLAAGAEELAQRVWHEGWSAWGSLPAKLLQKANALRGAAVTYGRLRLYSQWATGLFGRVSAARALLGSELTGIADTRSLPALNAWMRFRQTASAADRMLVEAQPIAAFGDATSPAARVLGKVALPVAMAGDVATIIKPGDQTGAHATTTRVMAGANFAASGTLLAAGAGVVTLTPVGAAVVGGVLVGTAAYAVGDLVYENREEIVDAVGNAAEWTGDRLDDAADTLLHWVS